VVRFTPRPLYPQGKSPLYPLDMRLGRPQSRSGRGGGRIYLYAALIICSFFSDLKKKGIITFASCTQKIVAQWLPYILCSREVLGSNLDIRLIITTAGFVIFISTSRRIMAHDLTTDHECFASHLFHLIIKTIPSFNAKYI
jgi:hypothetical protein